MNKHLQYNFYNNHIKKINNSKYLFEGKLNEPNIILIDNGKNILFSSQYLSLDSNEGNTESFLIVDNSPMTNHNKNLQLRFPVITDQSIENNGLDYVFSDKSNELELNSLLPDDENVEYIEDDTKITIIFQRPIKIKTVLKNDKGEHKSIIQEGFNMENVDIPKGHTLKCDEVPVNEIDDYYYDISLDNGVHPDFSLTYVKFITIFYIFIYMLVLYIAYNSPMIYNTLLLSLNHMNDPELQFDIIRLSELLLYVLLFYVSSTYIIEGSKIDVENKKEGKEDFNGKLGNGIFIMVSTFTIIVFSFLYKNFLLDDGNDGNIIAPDGFPQEWSIIANPPFKNQVMAKYSEVKEALSNKE